MKGRFAVLGWIVLLAAAVRVSFLFAFAIDDDEYYTLRNAEHVAADFTPEAVRAYPVAFVLTRACLELFGRNDFGLRILPVACGILGVFLLARVGRSLVSERAALLAALLVAVWPWHQYFSGLARYYALLFVFATALLWFAVRLVERWSAKDAVAAAACLAVLGLTHPTGLFAGAALLPVAVGDRARWRRAWKPTLAVLVALAAIVAFTPLRTPIVRVLTGAAGHGNDAVRFGYGFVLAVSPAVLLLAMFGAGELLRASTLRFRVLLAAAVVPVVAVLALALCGFQVQPRYTLVGMPALLLAAGAGLERLTRPLLERPALAAVAVLATLAPFLPSLVSNLKDGDRHDVSAVAEMLRAKLEPSDVLQAEAHSLLRAELFGFERWLPPGHREPDGTPHPAVFDEMPPHESALRVIALTGQHAWFVTSANPWEAPPSREARECVDWLRRHSRRVARIGARRYDYHRNVLYVFECGERRA